MRKTIKICFKSIIAIIYGIAKFLGLIRLFSGLIRFCEFCYSEWICCNLKCHCTFRYPINNIHGTKYITIGKGTDFGKQIVLTAWDQYEDDTFTPEIHIGDRCHFGDYIHITAINRIIIGNGVLTGRWVTITDNSHGETNHESLTIPPINRRLNSKGPVIIGDNVWIGDKATILPGVTISEGAIIAANAVVTKNIPAFSVAAGNPAKIIKTESKDYVKA